MVTLLMPKTKTTRGRLWRYAPLVLWMGLIFFASTGELSAENTSQLVAPVLRWLFPGISKANLAWAHFMVRKAAHFTEYGVFALLAARAFAHSSRDALRRHWFLISLLLIALYSLSDEFHQSFEPTRTASIYDSMIDCAGGFTALVLYWLLRKRGGSNMRSRRA